MRWMRRLEVAKPGLALRAGGFLTAVVGAYAWLAASPGEVGPAPASQPAPAPAPAPEPAIAPTPMAGSALGLVLYGVSGGGTSGLAAIIGPTTGGQRLVPLGKEYRPGVKLTELGREYAILDTGGRPVRLELRRFGEAAASEAPGRTDSERERGIESAVLRNILKPVVSNGRIGGYALKGGETLPRLQRAGLKPGDVIVSVNGSQFDEERMGELATEMANATRTEFVFVRNGKRIRATI
jgi:general secretion pathway protein C